MTEMDSFTPEPIPERSSEQLTWSIVQVKTRIDSQSQTELIDEVKRLRAEGKRRIALNLRNNRFLSFPAIRYCVDTAKEMRASGGLLALVACSEKTKRHFEIYASLDPICIVRDESDLLTLATRD
jgi:anti-anti-sigma factor